MTTIDDLRSIIAKMRYVKTGDILLADDHNLLVDFDKTLVDYLSGVESRIVSIEEQVASLQQQVTQPTPEEYADALTLTEAAIVLSKVINSRDIWFGVWSATRYYLAEGQWAFTAKWLDDPFPCDCWKLKLNSRDVAKAVVDAGLVMRYRTLPTGVWNGLQGVYLSAPTYVDMTFTELPVYGLGMLLSMWRPSEMLDELAWAKGIYGEDKVFVYASYLASIVYVTPNGAMVRIDFDVLIYPSNDDTVVMDISMSASNATLNPTSITITLPSDKRLVVAFLVAWPSGSQYGRLYIIVADEDGNVVDAIEFTSTDGSADIADVRLLAIPDVICEAANGQTLAQITGYHVPITYYHGVPPAVRAAGFRVEGEAPTITATRTVTVSGASGGAGAI